MSSLDSTDVPVATDATAATDATPQPRPPVSLRPMVKADIDRVMAHEEELFGPESWSPDSYRAELADRRYRHYLVAERVTAQPVNAQPVTGEQAAGAQAELVGWAGLMVVAETAQVLTIGVVPAEQGRGIGQTMLDELLAEARRRAATEVVLEVRVDNLPARRLYERNRFVPLRIRRGYYDLGRVDAVEMKREL
jgi:ribosomal-protein-alanine N-acetyltransferase